MRKYRQYSSLNNIHTSPYGTYKNFQDFIENCPLEIRDESEFYIYYGSSNCNYILSKRTGNIYENFAYHGKNLFEKLVHDLYLETAIINHDGYIGYIVANHGNFDYSLESSFKVKRLLQKMDNLCNKIIVAENGDTYLAYSRMQNFIKELYCNSLYNNAVDKTSFLHALEYYVKIAKEYIEIWGIVE